jgi:hypothetical protein
VNSVDDALSSAELMVPSVIDVIEVSTPNVHVDLYQPEYAVVLEVLSNMKPEKAAPQGDAKPKNSETPNLGISVYAAKGRVRITGQPNVHTPGISSFLLQLSGLVLDVCATSAGEVYAAVTTSDFSLFEDCTCGETLSTLQHMFPKPFQVLLVCVYFSS